jgi:hypothetical protein
MHDPANELKRITLPRTPVNKAEGDCCLTLHRLSRLQARRAVVSAPPDLCQTPRKRYEHARTELILCEPGSAAAPPSALPRARTSINLLDPLCGLAFS